MSARRSEAPNEAPEPAAVYRDGGEDEDEDEAEIPTALATPTLPERTATKAGGPPGTSTFWPGESTSLSGFAASQVAASRERREKGRNFVSQAVSSSGGVKKSEEEEEEVGVEEEGMEDDEAMASV